MERLKSKIAAVNDFPQPGIVFRDITPLLMDPDAIKFAIHGLVEPFRGQKITAVAGMEARGFIFGALAAQELGSGFVPLRKPGKLPREVETISYDLEYGSAVLEVHADAAMAGDRVLLVDDLIATGGTAAASCALLEQLGAEVVACAFVIELDTLQGRAKLEGRKIHSLVHF